MAPSKRRSMMAAEAAEAADVVARQLALNRDILARLRDHFAAAPPSLIATCARGSSDHSASYGRFLFETQAGISCTSLAPSVASIYGSVPIPAQALCLAISQSGQSPDLLAVVRQCRDRGIRTLAITNDEGSPLAGLADLTLPLRAGRERSVAATKSYIGSLFAVLGVADALAPGCLGQVELATVPVLLRQAALLEWSALMDRLAGARGLYVVGRGPGLAIAAEAALKFKETCGLHAEAFSSAEIRHGPMAMVDKDFPVLVFRQDDESAAGTDRLVQDLAARKVPVFIAGANIPGAVSLPTVATDPRIEPLLQIQSFYPMVAELAWRRGHDPDNPPQLSKVTETF